MKRARTRGYLQNSIWYLGSIHYRLMLVKMVKQFSMHRVFQALFAVAEWKLHRTNCSSRPFAFRIEPTATCNLRCPLCSTTHRKFHHGDVRVMTLNLFQTILEKIRKHAWRMTFYMEGEPMMHPQLFKMIELSTCDRHLFTSFSTNLTLMHENLVSPLFQSRIDWISVSLDGFTQETYEKYRVNGSVRKVLDGIGMIMAWKKRHELPYPYLQVNMIDFSHIPEKERRDLEMFCATNNVDEFRIRPDQTGQMGRYDPKITRKPPSKCHWPWISMSIDCDGSVYPCPIAFEQRISYGNLKSTRFEEIWNNKLYIRTREYLSGRTGACEEEPKLPCHNCRWYGNSEGGNKATHSSRVCFINPEVSSH